MGISTAQLVELIDNADEKAENSLKQTAAVYRRLQSELKSVDGELATLYDRLTLIAQEIAPLIQAKNRLDTVLQQLVDMAGTQAQIAGQVAHLRATPTPSMAHMRETQVAVDATMKPGEGLVMVMDGEVCTVSLEELGVYLGLTDELTTPLTAPALGIKE